MAIGTPFDTERGFGAGGVNILYGSATGPEAPSLTTLYFDQDTSGVAETADSGDQFGTSLAWGDFDGDGYDDLIIGVPYEDFLSLTNAGYVNVLYGGSGGLSTSGSQSFSGGFGSTPYTAASHDAFGWNVTAGDFDGDGYDDVAISADGYDSGAASGNEGGVVILYGSSSGLSVTDQQVFHQDSTGIAGDGGQTHDYFGSSLATGDFDCDGYEDLAIGARGEDIAGGGADHGAVTVLYGTSSGLSTTGSQWWHQGVTGIEGTNDSFQAFGEYGLVAANFDGDSSSSLDCVDLAIGVYNEYEMGYTGNGAVNIIYGSTSGLTATGDQLLYQGAGLAGSPADSSHVGMSLTVGRFNSDSYDDLAAGAPYASPGGLTGAGEIYLAKGSNTGLTSSGAVRWDALTADVAGTRETGDTWGFGMSFAQSEGASSDTYLFVGSYDEDSGQGAVCEIKLDSTNTAFDALTGGFEWKQDDIEGTPVNNEHFGFTMPAPRLKARAIN